MAVKQHLDGCPTIRRHYNNQSTIRRTTILQQTIRRIHINDNPPTRQSADIFHICIVKLGYNELGFEYSVKNPIQFSYLASIEIQVECPIFVSLSDNDRGFLLKVRKSNENNRKTPVQIIFCIEQCFSTGVPPNFLFPTFQILFF